MKHIKEIKKFEAGYSREGYVSLVVDKCFLCGEEKVCLYSDGSEGEYGGVSICGDCAKKQCDSVGDFSVSL